MVGASDAQVQAELAYEHQAFQELDELRAQLVEMERTTFRLATADDHLHAQLSRTEKHLAKLVEQLSDRLSSVEAQLSDRLQQRLPFELPHALHIDDGPERAKVHPSFEVAVPIQGHRMVTAQPPSYDTVASLQDGTCHMMTTEPQNNTTQPAADKLDPLSKVPSSKDLKYSFEELIHPLIEYEFSESLWDAAYFVFSRRIGVAANVYVLLILLLNITCQIIFLGILLTYFKEPEFNHETVDQMHRWRVVMGHNALWADPGNDESLTRVVCKKDMATGISFDKMELYKQLQRYWNIDKPDVFFSGPALAVVCILAWASTCVGEMRKTWRCAIVVFWGTPSGRFTIEGSQESGFELVAISWPRRLWIGGLVLMQFLIANVLLYTGCVFIASTTSLETLLLHALAMEIIFTTDERFFEALVPHAMQNLVKCMKPMELRIRAWKGMDFKTVTAALILVAVMIGFWFGAVAKALHVAVDVQQALCGGNRDFMYNVDAVGVVWWMPAHTAELVPSTESLVDYLRDAKNLWEVPYPFRRDTLDSLKTRGADMTSDLLQQMQNATARIPVKWCSDLYLPEESRIALMPVAEAITNFGPRLVTPESSEGTEPPERPKNCEELEHMCQKSALVRTVCSSTCGCDNPLGGVLTSDLIIGGGCADNACLTFSPRYIQMVQNASCADVEDDTMWQEWSRQFEAILAEESPPPGAEWPCDVLVTGQCSHLFSEQKCSIVSFWQNWSADALSDSASADIDPCRGIWSPTVALKPLTTACPIACECDGRRNQSKGCPPCIPL